MTFPARFRELFDAGDRYEGYLANVWRKLCDGRERGQPPLHRWLNDPSRVRSKAEIKCRSTLDATEAKIEALEDRAGQLEYELNEILWRDFLKALGK